MENSNTNLSPEMIVQLKKLLEGVPVQSNGNIATQDEYDDYIYILKEAKYYSIVHKKLFTVREVASNLQALIGDISISERTILDARKDRRIKIYNDFCFGEDEEGKYNLYDSSFILKADMDNPNLHPLIQELLEDVTNGNTADMEYILKWIGWKYLHPLSPMCSSLVLKGGQGSGKGHIVSLMQTIFSSEYTKTNISPENFASRFSSTDEHTLVCELAEQGETDYKTLIKTSTKLKTLVMQNELQVERKYKDLETIANHTVFIITSNRQVPLILDDKSIGNRRYSFFQGDKVYDDVKGAQVRSVITDKEEVARLLGYILSQWGEELRAMSVYSAHKNEIKDILEQSAGNEFQQFWDYLRETRMGELISHTQLRVEFAGFCNKNGYAHERLKSKLLRECPWREVRPDTEQGEQLERHRLVQPIGCMGNGGGLSKLISHSQQIESVNGKYDEGVPADLKDIESIF